jgi:hypothetical protein
MQSVKNGKLFEDIPARSFCRSAQQNLLPLSRQQLHQQNPAPDADKDQPPHDLHALTQ